MLPVALESSEQETDKVVDCFAANDQIFLDPGPPRTGRQFEDNFRSRITPPKYIEREKEKGSGRSARSFTPASEKDPRVWGRHKGASAHKPTNNLAD